MPRKPTRSRLVLITGLASFSLATAGCPITTNPPPNPQADSGDSGDTGDTGDTAESNGAGGD
jgi:hypothetical protein